MDSLNYLFKHKSAEVPERAPLQSQKDTTHDAAQ